MTIRIRDAVPDELAEIIAMMQELARQRAGTTIVPPDQLHRLILDDRLGRLLVAAEADGLIGYALILPDRPTGIGREVSQVFVHEWRRHAGIGRALIAVARQVNAGAGARTIQPAA